MASKKDGAYALYALGVAILCSFLWFGSAESACTPLGTTTAQLGLCKPQAGETGWSAAINQNWDTVDANVGTIPTGAIMLYGGNIPPGGWYVCDGTAKSRTSDANLFAVFGTTYGAGDGSTTFNLPNASSRVAMFAGTGSFVSATAFSNVNTGSDNITVPTNSSLYTGTQINFSTTGTAPGGLTNGNNYFVINVSSTVIQLASTRANAVSGTQIDLTTQGTGTHSFTVAYSTRNLADAGGEETHALTGSELTAHTHVEQYGSGITTTGMPTGTTNGSASTASVTLTSPTGGSGSHNIMQPFIAFTCMVKR